MTTNELFGLELGGTGSKGTLLPKQFVLGGSSKQTLLVQVRALAEERQLALERYVHKPDAKDFHIERENKLLAILWTIVEVLSQAELSPPTAGFVLNDILTGQQVSLGRMVDDFFIQRQSNPLLTGLLVRVFIMPGVNQVFSHLPLDWFLKLGWE